MSTSSDKPGIALAEELRRQSEQDATVTPMDAVLEAARNSKFSDDHCFRLLSRLWTLKRLMYYVYGGWASRRRKEAEPRRRITEAVLRRRAGIAEPESEGHAHPGPIVHPPAWRFSLPGAVNQHCSGITETEGRENRDKGVLAERAE